MAKDEDFELQEARTKANLLDQAKRAIAVRSQDREFHGLEREFLYHQSQMLLDFEKSKDIHHPRDVGDAREEILKKFFKESGYLPARFAILFVCAMHHGQAYAYERRLQPVRRECRHEEC